MRQIKGLLHAGRSSLAKRMGIAVGVATIMLSQAAYAVFFTPGQFGVSPTGAANYSIPIALPPGTGGMAPSLAINYNSQGGNGHLGIGWSLSGLSAITRCPKSVAQDGVKSPVQYTTADRYCLDGQRLVAVAGAYGANGTEYRTERDSFSKIMSWGSSGSPASGPAIFKVWTKSGLLMEYGNTADSLVVQQGKTHAQVWALNKVIDTKGNYYTITYQDNGVTNGEFYPTRIDYTGNANTGLLPYNSVRFVYVNRSDTPILYDGSGSIVQSTKVLANIQTYANVNAVDTLVKDYRLAYTASPKTARARLNSVTECAGDGTCLQPTTVTWNDASAPSGIASANNTVAVISGNDWTSTNFDKIEGDFDGDGATDLFLIGVSSYFCTDLSSPTTRRCVLIDSTNWRQNYGVGTTGTASFFVATPTYYYKSNSPTIFSGDYNGDGISDLFMVGDTGSLFCAGPRIASANNCVAVANAVGWRGTFDFFPGDYNGDGITDLYLIGNSASYFCAGPGIASVNNCVQTVAVNWKAAFGSTTTTTTTYTQKSSTQKTTTYTTTYYVTPSSIYTGDYNGDGFTDLYLVGTSASYFCPGPGIATASNCRQTVAGDWKTPYSVYPGDYNGDGITDLVLISDASNYVCYGPGVSNAGNCAAFLGPASGWRTAYTFVPGDYDGDGKTELMLQSDGANYMCSDIAAGTVSCKAITAAGSYWRSAYSIYPGDYNGDGTTDLFLIGSTASYFAAGAAMPDKLTTITNGLGASTTVAYKPLTDVSVYSKGTGSVYPVMDIKVPIYVVSSVKSSDGIGGLTNTDYSYYYARAHQKGGGFLGFEYVRSCDTMVVPNVCNQTRYTQDYPHQGLASTVLKFVKNATTTPYLNLVSNTWSYGTNAAWGAAYHVPQLTQSQEISYELASGGAVQGAGVTSVLTTNAYDLYGNPTVITVTPAGGFSKTTTNTYVNDPVNWFLGRLTGATVTSTAP